MVFGFQCDSFVSYGVRAYCGGWVVGVWCVGWGGGWGGGGEAKKVG